MPTAFVAVDEADDRAPHEKGPGKMILPSPLSSLSIRLGEQARGAVAALISGAVATIFHLLGLKPPH
jgi:hypothetical protein